MPTLATAAKLLTALAQWEQDPGAQRSSNFAAIVMQALCLRNRQSDLVAQLDRLLQTVAVFESRSAWRKAVLQAVQYLGLFLPMHWAAFELIIKSQGPVDIRLVLKLVRNHSVALWPVGSSELAQPWGPDGVRAFERSTGFALFHPAIAPYALSVSHPADLDYILAPGTGTQEHLCQLQHCAINPLPMLRALYQRDGLLPRTVSATLRSPTLDVLWWLVVEHQVPLEHTDPLARCFALLWHTYTDNIDLPLFRHLWYALAPGLLHDHAATAFDLLALTMMGNLEGMAPLRWHERRDQLCGSWEQLLELCA